MTINLQSQKHEKLIFMEMYCTIDCAFYRIILHQKSLTWNRGILKGSVCVLNQAQRHLVRPAISTVCLHRTCHRKLRQLFVFAQPRRPSLNTPNSCIFPLRRQFVYRISTIILWNLGSLESLRLSKKMHIDIGRSDCGKMLKRAQTAASSCKDRYTVT